MEILWTRGPATVSEVAEGLPKSLDLAYNTVLTTLRILEEKKYVRHTKPKDTKAFVYKPVVTREQASRSALRTLLRRFFANSPEALVLNLIEDEKLSEAERERIRQLFNENA
jgi:predicted transcriptional regulator